MALGRLFLRPESSYADHDIRLMTGTPVAAIDPAAREVVFVDGERRAYGQLALTTGAVPCRLPGAIGGGLAGVHVVRTLADVDAMAPDFVAGARVLVVGGGQIGLDAAAVAAQKGLHVTLVEAAPRILGRVAAPETAAWFRDLHARHGVDIREGTGLSHLTGDGRVTGAVLDDGSELAADFVITGIGIAPATSLAEGARLAIDNGIAVDAQGRA